MSKDDGEIGFTTPEQMKKAEEYFEEEHRSDIKWTLFFFGILILLIIWQGILFLKNWFS